MKTSTLTTAATLLSTTYAATVTISTTPCLDPHIPLQQETIEMNLSGPVARDFPAVCGMKILSASPGIDINTIHCQAFKDVVGTQPGSAIFTYAHPASIATNPVQEMAVRCTYPVHGAHAKRQSNETASVSSPGSSASASASDSARLSLSTVTLSASSGSASVSQSTITRTTIASSGLPSSSANGTVSSSRSPSASQTSATPAQSSGAAAGMGVGVGMGVVAGFVAMFL
ncbi:hypothetical protein FB567DRAFT_549254 [Paraphoma chrysanthemicola]|uniref:GPI anchored cell wall protein n=1 Tax=Paraphoma chrysanthemicola TaxID=798071 RepID=A0A8K0R565_9PLEO|nr:hypothetical protein FB567DRAFT_549254 [Paraphoma chrysanthemicola]